MVEAFAGTHPAANVIKKTNAHGPDSKVKVTAYVSIELLEPSQLGLQPFVHQDLGISRESHYLRCQGAKQGDVGSPQVQRRVVEFVQQQLAEGAVDAVVVFGGPPCTEYSNARRRDDKGKVEAEAEKEYLDAILAHAQARKASGEAVRAYETMNRAMLNADQQEDVTIVAFAELQKKDTAAEHEASAIAAREKAAAEASAEAAKGNAALLDSDALVKRFINLYKRIEAECKCYGSSRYWMLPGDGESLQLSCLCPLEQVRFP